MSRVSINIIRSYCSKDKISESVWVVHEILETFIRAELSLDTDRVQAPRDLLGDPGQLHGDQRYGHIGPHRPSAQALHPRVQVGEEEGGDILLRDPDPSLDQVHRGELHQRGHGGQAVPEGPGLRGGVKCVVTELQTVQPEEGGMR